LRRLPFTTNTDLRDTYPTGLLAIPSEDVLRLHTSSGTTGKPKALFFLAPGRGQRRRVDGALPGHDRRDPSRRAPKHDDLRPVYRRIGHALRRGKSRLPGDSGRTGQLRETTAI